MMVDFVNVPEILTLLKNFYPLAECSLGFRGQQTLTTKG